jgi:hypothetical protein
MPPTGKEGTWTSIDIYRIAGGKVVEQWSEADVTGFMQRSASGHIRTSWRAAT